MLNKKNIFASCLNFLKPTKGKLVILFILLILSTIIAFGVIDPDYNQGTFQMPAPLKILFFIFFGLILIISKYTEVLESLGVFQLILLNSLYIYILSCATYFLISWIKNKRKTNIAHFKSLPFGLKFIIVLFLINPFLGLWIFSDLGFAPGLYIVSILIVTVFSLAAAYFLYKRKNWMRLTVIVLAIMGIISLVFNVMAMVPILFLSLQAGSGGLRDFIIPLSLIVVPILVNIFFVWYLSRKRIKALFS